VAIAQITYLYPYFKALKIADASIVSALFNLGKIFVPALAFIIVNERLSLWQYTGFIIIILSSFMLTYHGGLKINKSLMYMAITSIIIAIMSTVTKYALDSIDWITVMTWTAVFSTTITILIGTAFLRKEIISHRKAYFQSFWQFMINEFVTFIAMACMIYAVAQMPVTIVQGLLALQPIFMMFLAFLGNRFLPEYFKEDIRLKTFLKKSIFFILIAIGVYLTFK
jgi:drug/metabolite transporter (DMT)-like permease